MAWIKVWPESDGTATSAVVSGSTAQIRANWDAMDEAFGLQHASMSSGACGDHVPGKNPVVYRGTYSEIAALTSAPSGSIALDSGEGSILIAPDTGDWDLLSQVNGTYRTYVYAANYIGTAYTSVPSFAKDGWRTIDYVLGITSEVDLNSEFDPTTTTSGTFTASADGLYMATLTIIPWGVAWTGSSYSQDTPTAGFPYQNLYLKIGLFKNGATEPTSQAGFYVSNAYGYIGQHCRITDIIDMNAGDTLQSKLYHQWYTSMRFYAYLNIARVA